MPEHSWYSSIVWADYAITAPNGGGWHSRGVSAIEPSLRMEDPLLARNVDEESNSR
jgi:hypothetical protein